MWASAGDNAISPTAKLELLMSELDERRIGQSAAVELADCDLLIYDPTNGDAWLRSDVTKALSAVR